MKKIYTSLIFTLIYLSVNAQNHTDVSGGEASGTGGKVSYSIGQIDFANSTSAAGAVTQGVQQPYEIQILTGIDKVGITLIASVYPNPTTETLILKIENNKLESLFYELFDMQGGLLSTKKIETSESIISMKEFANATYLIKVFNEKNEVKTFKLIKNK